MSLSHRSARSSAAPVAAVATFALVLQYVLLVRLTLDTIGPLLATVLRWLRFPLAYACWVFLRGAWAHEYPYPFLDPGALALPAVLRNCAGVFALFLLLGAVLVLVDRCSGRAKQAAAAT